MTGVDHHVVDRTGIWLAGFFTCWAAYSLLHVYPGYVHQDPAEIFMWSQTGWAWGYDKHPPLLPWLFRAFDSVIPIDFTTLNLLAAANLTLSAACVLAIADRVLGPERRALVLLLITLSPLMTWQAIKLNHNSILVSLWPLAILALLRYRERPTLLRGVLLGIAAGLTLLAKFYSALLLATMAVALLPDIRRWIVTPSAWIAALVPVVVIAPHLAWLTSVDPDAIILGIEGRPEDAGSIRNLLTRNFTNSAPPLLALLMSALSLVGWRAILKPRIETANGTEFRIVLTVFVLPWLVSLVANVLLELRGSASWTMPVFTMLPILLAALIPAEHAGKGRSGLRIATAALLILAVAAAPLVLVALFRKGHPAAIEPRFELARQAADVWTAATGHPLRVTAGELQFGVNGALVLPNHPTAWVNYRRLPYMQHIDTAKTGFLAMCETTDAKCRRSTQRRTAMRTTLTCTLEASRTLYGLRGKSLKVFVAIVPPANQEPAPVPGCTLQGPAVG